MARGQARILLVDDERTLRESCASVLQMDGYNVTLAGRGEEALDLVERFVETVEATLPSEALIVKTIGDEVMIVSPDPVTLTEWAVGFLGLFSERPQPRVGLHYGRAVYRDGDYYGRAVNLASRVGARAAGGEVLVTRPVVEAAGRVHAEDVLGTVVGGQVVDAPHAGHRQQGHEPSRRPGTRARPRSLSSPHLPPGR